MTSLLESKNFLERNGSEYNGKDDKCHFFPLPSLFFVDKYIRVYIKKIKKNHQKIFF